MESVVEEFWEVAWGVRMGLGIHPVFRNFPLLSAALVVAVLLKRYHQDYQRFRTIDLVALREG